MFVHLIVLWRHIQSGWRLYEKYARCACTNINHTIYGINIVDQNSHKEHVSHLYIIKQSCHTVSKFPSLNTRNNMYDRIRIWCTAHAANVFYLRFLAHLRTVWCSHCVYWLQDNAHSKHQNRARKLYVAISFPAPNQPPTRPKTLCCYDAYCAMMMLVFYSLVSCL